MSEVKSMILWQSNLPCIASKISTPISALFSLSTGLKSTLNIHRRHLLKRKTKKRQMGNFANINIFTLNVSTWTIWKFKSPLSLSSNIKLTLFIIWQLVLQSNKLSAINENCILLARYRNKERSTSKKHWQ